MGQDFKACRLDLTYPEGPTYTTIMELGPKNQNRDGIGSVYGVSS